MIIHPIIPIIPVQNHNNSNIELKSRGPNRKEEKEYKKYSKKFINLKLENRLKIRKETLKLLTENGVHLEREKKHRKFNTSCGFMTALLDTSSITDKLKNMFVCGSLYELLKQYNTKDYEIVLRHLIIDNVIDSEDYNEHLLFENIMKAYCDNPNQKFSEEYYEKNRVELQSLEFKANHFRIFIFLDVYEKEKRIIQLQVGEEKTAPIEITL